MEYDRLPDLQTPRCAHGFTVAGGELCAFGGHTTGFVPVATAEYFSDGEWHTIPMTYPHAGGIAFWLSRHRKKATETELSASEQLMLDIRTILEEKQLYKVHGLQVADLAKELGTNTTYISACINKETRASFNDLVNGCRIRHALDLLAGNPGMPVTQVADLSGFSSYSSFLRSFRQFTGKTPTEYLSADDPAAGTQP